MAILFAFVTMLCYGSDILLVRKGLIKSPNAMVAAFITLSVNACFFLIYVLIAEPLSNIGFSMIYYFVIAGIMAPGLARVFNYKAVQKVGVSLTAPNYPKDAFPDGIRIHFHFNGVFNGCKAAGAGSLIVPRTIAVPRVLAPTCPRCARPYAPAMTVSHAR